MWLALGVGVDLIHALAMVAWVVGFPLLFIRRWPRARIGYAAFAIFFIVVSQTSMVFLHECVLTTFTRWLWRHDPGHVVNNEWFTLRAARAVFGMAPSKHLVSRLSEILVLATAVGVIISVVRSHQDGLASRRRGGARPGRGSRMFAHVVNPRGGRGGAHVELAKHEPSFVSRRLRKDGR